MLRLDLTLGRLDRKERPVVTLRTGQAVVRTVTEESEVDLKGVGILTGL